MSVRLLTASSALWLASTLASAATPPTVAPTLLQPSGAIATARPTYNWRPVATATQYQLRVEGPGGVVLDAAFMVPQICDTNICTARPALDLVPGAHRWQVYAANSAGNGPTSVVRAFTVPSTAPRPTPTATPTPAPTVRPTATPAGTTFVTTLTPENGAVTNASGTSSLVLAADERSARVSLTFSGLTSAQTASHVHGPGDPGQSAPVLFSIPMGNFNDAVWVFQASGNVTVQQQVDAIKGGRIYINVHSANYPSGEIRGHYRPVTAPTPTPVPTAPTATPTPPTGTPSVPEAVRFLQQASWGANAASIDRVRALGYSGWIDEQMALPASTYSAHIQAAPTTNDDDRTRAFQAKFFNNALFGQDQLRQRVGWALSQIFVVSDLTIDDGPAMAFFVDMLNRNAFGSYQQFLLQLTLNPAMGDYLDMVNNVRPRNGRIANENYAREILQLFSIGVFRLNPDGSLVLDAQGKPIPTYDQAAIEGLARVFTGWTYAPQPGQPNNPRNPRYYLASMVLHQRNHDIGAKTILNGIVLPAGRDGSVDLSQALLVITQHPNVGPFIGRQLIQHLVTSNPSPGYVSRITRVFNNNGSGARGDLRAVVKAILMDPEARSATPPVPAFGKLKEPTLAMLQLLRAVNGVGDGLGLAGIARNMGQDPFRSPTVFNYYQPDYQLPGTPLSAPPFQIFNEATVVNRANWVNTVVFNTVNVPFGPAGTSVAIDLAPLQAIAADPVALVNRLDELLMHGRMSPGMKSALVTAVGKIAASRTRQRVQNALYLVATSAQFNVGR